MRKQNSEFKTAFTSEAECDLKNTDYFGFVELDEFACYVIADGIDDQTDAVSARLAVSAAVSAFSEAPSMSKRTMRACLRAANKALLEAKSKMKLKASVLIVLTNYTVSAFSEAPSMSKRTMRACLRAANKALLEAKSKMKLKASVLIVLTNYTKLRYGQAGNIRFRLYRNGFVKIQSTDQSLTADLVKKEKVTSDKVALHEERNNLYAYLGQSREFHPFISKKIKLTDADAIALYTRGVWQHIDEGELKDAFGEAYLGQSREFHPFISKKIKLTDADAIALYTRGVWQHIDEGELKDAFGEATTEPQELVNNVEDLLLSRQPKQLGKYTFVTIFINKVFKDPNKKRRIATTEPQELVNNVEDLLLSRQPKQLGKYTFVTIFINKVFKDPNKKRRIRRILMIVIPVLVMLTILSVVLFVQYRKKQEKRAQMETGYTDTIEYIQSDNYIRAQECCKDALELADQLKDSKMQKELGNYQKLIEAVLAAEDYLDNKKYTDAQNAYGEAANRSKYVDNVGIDYIEDRQELTADYIAVYDLINLGDTLVLNLQPDKAEEKYMEAKILAGEIYFDEGRQAAIDALEKLYADQKEEKEAENEELKEALAKQETAANYMAQGNEAFAEGDYESAKVYYSSARQSYSDMGDETQGAAAQEKLEITENKISQREAQKQEAENYVQQAENSAAAGDYLSAKKYYLLAKDVYASLKMEDKVEEITRKMDEVGIQEQQAQAAATVAEESSASQSETVAEVQESSKPQQETKPEKIGPGIGNGNVSENAG